MLVTGTGATGDEAYAIGKGAFDAFGHPVCTVNFPDFTTADIQVSVQYLVNGIRAMARRAGQPIAIFGISQGGLLPRFALTYWPSLRAKVTDVLAAAGTQHGTTLGDPAACAAGGCAPAVWQQAAGSKLLAALNAQPDETPGPDRLDDGPLDHRRDGPAADRPAPDLGAEGRHEHRSSSRCARAGGQPHRHRPRLGDLRRLRRRARPQGRRADRAPAQGRLRASLRARARRGRHDAVLGASGNLITPRLVNQVPRVTAEPPVRAYARRRGRLTQGQGVGAVGLPACPMPRIRRRRVALTLVTMTTGERYEVDGSAESVEAAIVGASRGSIMQLAWLTEAGTGRSIAINPLQSWRSRQPRARPRPAGSGERRSRPRARPGGERERQVERPGQVGLRRPAQVRALGRAGSRERRVAGLRAQPVRRRPGREAQRARRPVAVSSTPAAAAVATPCAPRMSTVAAAPTLGPRGSWLMVTIAMSTAIESKSDTATPVERRIR